MLWHEDPRRLWKRRLMLMDIGSRVEFPAGVTVRRAEWSYQLWLGGTLLNLTQEIGHILDREARVEAIIDWILKRERELSMAVQELSSEDRELIVRLMNDYLMPVVSIDAVQAEHLKSLALARETKDGYLMLTMSGRAVADELMAEPARRRTPHSNGVTPCDEASASSKAAPLQLTTPLSDKSLDTLRAVWSAGEAGTSVKAIKAHMLTIKKLRNLKLIRQRNDQLFITDAGAARLAAEGIAETTNRVMNDSDFIDAPSVNHPDQYDEDDCGAEAYGELPNPDVEDDPPTPTDAPNQIEVMISADTPEEALKTLREVTDAIVQGITATPGEAADAEYMNDDEAFETSTGCGECQASADCLDKRVLHMLMAARPEVVAIYNAEATREKAEMRRDSLLRALATTGSEG